MMHDTGLCSVSSARTIWGLAALCALTIGCVSSTPHQTVVDDYDEGVTNEDAEVVVSSIDPALPTPGPELRLARVELSRAEGSLLGGFIAVALTGDPGAVEILIRGLGEPDTCQDAAIGIAFLTKRLAVRPLYLALRLDCSSGIARDVAPLLDLGHLVEAARRDNDLPAIAARTSSTEEASATTESNRCPSVAAALRALSREEGELPTEFQDLTQAPWELPRSDSDLCAEPVLAAAVRLHAGDRGVQLAFDLILDTPGPLPRHIVDFVNQFGLGRTTPRLADRIEEADGVVCAAIVRAGDVEPALELLIESPLDVPRCLYPAARALRRDEGEQAQRALEAISATATATEAGCEAGALIAAIALLDRRERPPSWAADAALLGRAIAETLSRGSEGDRPTDAALRHFRTAATRLHPRRDPPAQEGPVRLYQRDIRTVQDAATGQRRSALRLLLEAGTR